MYRPILSCRFPLFVALCNHNPQTLRTDGRYAHNISKLKIVHFICYNTNHSNSLSHHRSRDLLLVLHNCTAFGMWQLLLSCSVNAVEHILNKCSKYANVRKMLSLPGCWSSVPYNLFLNFSEITIL